MPVRSRGSLLGMASPPPACEIPIFRVAKPWDRALTRSQYVDFIPQLIDELFRHLRRGTFDHFRLLRLLRNVQLFDFLRIAAERRLDLVERHLPQRLVLGLLDTDQRGVTQLVNAGLNG